MDDDIKDRKCRAVLIYFCAFCEIVLRLNAESVLEDTGMEDRRIK